MFGLGNKIVAASAAVIIGGIVIFYEGVPLGPLRLIPFVGPALETITDGRVDRERKAGAAGERILWEEARRKMLAKMEVERREAQDKINTAEREYLERRQGDALAIAGLEQAISEMEAADAENSCPARAAIPRGLSNSLNKIGR